MHGETPEDGRDYPDDSAECAEIAAARYALCFTKRFVNLTVRSAYVFVVVTWGEENRGHTIEVRVDVKQDSEAPWGWRVSGVGRQ